MQRYENKSKSQPNQDIFNSVASCLRPCKDTKIKANHNRSILHFFIFWLSKTLQRYENKSKSQLTIFFDPFTCCCLRPCKDTKIKANHNTSIIIWWYVRLSKTLQRYKNKSKSQLCIPFRLLCVGLSKTLQRYKNKSKSQLHWHFRKRHRRCLRPCKDTKIKANHNYVLARI